MSTNDRNEGFFDKNDAAFDASEGELSQDELNNVSGGLRSFEADRMSNAEGRSVAKLQDEDDKSDRMAM